MVQGQPAAGQPLTSPYTHQSQVPIQPIGIHWHFRFGGHSFGFKHSAKLRDPPRVPQRRARKVKAQVRSALAADGRALKAILTVGVAAHFRGKRRMDRLGLASGLEAPLHLPGFGSPFVFTFSGGFQRQAKAFGQRFPVLAQQAVIRCQEPATAPTSFRFSPGTVGKLEG